MSNLHHRVYLPADLLVALGEKTGIFWSDFRLEPIIADAVRAWMNPAPAAQSPQQQAAAASGHGYQWKQVFLPEGTRLRACFDHQPYFAVVEGARIKYGEHAISPSCFANLHGSGNRNAWKAVWLRFPGSEEWLLADVCRAARNAAIVRLFGGDAPELSQRQGKSGKGNKEDRANKRRQRPPLRTDIGAINAAERTALTSQPAALPSWSLPNESRPPGVPETKQGTAARSKNRPGRSARRKRRGAKHVAANP